MGGGRERLTEEEIPNIHVCGGDAAPFHEREGEGGQRGCESANRQRRLVFLLVTHFLSSSQIPTPLHAQIGIVLKKKTHGTSQRALHRARHEKLIWETYIMFSICGPERRGVLRRFAVC